MQVKTISEYLRRSFQTKAEMCLSDCHLHQKKAFHIWQGTHTKMLMHVAMEILKGHNIRPELQGAEINKEKAGK